MKNKLHPGAKWQFRIGNYFLLLILFFFLLWLGGFLSIMFKSGNLLLVGILIYLPSAIIIGEIVTKMAYNRWFYELTSTNLKIERGIIWKRYSNIPYERIQNVDIRRGIIARILGFSAIMIQTAGYSYSNSGGSLLFGGGATEGYLPAVDIKEAEKIREFLMEKISKTQNKGM